MRRWGVVSFLLVAISVLAVLSPVYAAPGADLVLTKTVSGSSIVAPGDLIHYNISVSNLGDDAANTIVIEDDIPANTTFVGVTGSLGTFSGVSPGGTGKLTITIPGSHAKGAGTSYSLTLRVNCVAGPFNVLNVAQASSSTPDPNGANNSASTSVVVLGSPPPSCGQPPPTTASNDYSINVQKCVGCGCTKLTPDSRCSCTLSTFCAPDCEGDHDHVLPPGAQKSACAAIKCGLFGANPADKFGFGAANGIDFPIVAPVSPVFIPLGCTDEGRALLRDLYKQLLDRTPADAGAEGNRLLNEVFGSGHGGGLGFPSIIPPGLQAPVTFLQWSVAANGATGEPSSLSLFSPFGNLPNGGGLCPPGGECPPIILFDMYLIDVQNLGTGTSDVNVDLTPDVRAAIQSLFDPPNQGVFVDSSSVMAMAAPASVAQASSAPAVVSIATTSAPPPGGTLSFKISGLSPGQRVTIPVLTAVALQAPGAHAVFAARLTAAGDTNASNDKAGAIEGLTVSATGASPKPVAPQVFQNPAAIIAVQPRPKTPTPTVAR